MLRLLGMAAICCLASTLFAQGGFLFDYAATDGPLRTTDPHSATLNVDPLALSESFTVKLNLPGAHQYAATFDRIARRHPVGKVAIYHGTTHDPAWAHLSHYRDLILAVDEQSGRLVLHAFTADGVFSALPNADGTYTVAEEMTPECTQDGGTRPGGLFQEAPAPPAAARMSGCNEQDQNGDYVVDMYFGYSHQAAAQLGDLTAYSVAQIETVNLGLQNSQVPDLYLRLVDVGVRDIHVGVVGSSINAFYNYFLDDFNAAGADMGAFYDTAFPGANNGGGFAFVPGRASINAAGSTGVFRHEWGHNSGSKHCPTDGGGTSAYSSGWSNGNVNTHMCGNNINFYSNPNLTDANGTPIGSATEADNTRNITERRTVYSGYAQHTIPYDAADTGNGCTGTGPAEGRYYLRNVASGNYLSPVGNGQSNQYIDQSATAGATEEWDVHRYTSGQYFIYFAAANKALDLYGGSGTAGANVGTWSINNNSSNQRWRIEPVGNGNFRIRPVLNAFCLQIPAGQTAAQDLIIQDDCLGTTDSEWQFVPVTNSAAAHPPVQLNIATTAAACNGVSSGSITLTATGGNGTYTYAWSNGATTASLANVPAGSYSVTVTSNGRNHYTTAAVRSGKLLTPEVSTTDATLTTGGTATVSGLANATAPVTYAWSDGGSGANRANLAGGLYTVTITDADGCSDQRQVQIFDAPADGTELVIQHVASGLYLHVLQGNTSGDLEYPIVLGHCPTDDLGYRWRADKSFANVFTLLNVRANRRLTPRSLEGTGNPFRVTGFDGNTERFRLERNAAGNWTLVSNQTLHGVGGSNLGHGDALVQTEPNTGTPAELRFLPVVAGSGTACDDSDNTTDDDQINLLGQCCGAPNYCYGIGNADGDRDCTDTDCDDTTAAIYVGATCDDADATTFRDAYLDDCGCTGCETTGSAGTDVLTNVAGNGTVTVSSNYPGAAPASALVDGDTNGNWFDGTVWHGTTSSDLVEIDLGGAYPLREIVIYPRTDCCTDRLNNAYVLASDQPFSGNDLETMIGAADLVYRVPANYNSGAPLTIELGHTARYLRVRATTSLLNLAEIEAKVCPLQAALPVDDLRLTGRADGAVNQLQWTTRRERANAGFAVERSTDGIGFETLDWVPGRGDSEAASTYRYTDARPAARTHYYRLRQVDFDGTTSYSATVAIARSVIGWHLAPNPVGAARELRIGGAATGGFELLDLTGRTLRTYAPGERVLRLAGLPGGVYFLRHRADGSVQRVVVE